MAVGGVALVVTASWILAIAIGHSRLLATVLAASPLVVLYGAFFLAHAMGLDQQEWVGFLAIGWVVAVNFWQARKAVVRMNAQS
jgi:hypothetical protein